MAEISVIVPVFNVENYLEECLDSILNQSFDDIEVICVNDGSTDKSGEILNEFAKRDDRIQVISQQNRGLGAARNAGLNAAGGKYIYFIDSDDYIDLKTLEKLHRNAISNDSDIVLFKFQTFDNNNNIHHRGVEFKIDKIFGDIDYSNFTFSYMDAKRHVMNSAFSACLKLYKKAFLDLFDDFYFPEGISFEDVIFHVKAMLRASRISFVNESLYYYRSNVNSILNSTANGFDIFEVIDSVEMFLKENDYYENLESEFIFFKVAQILVYLISTGTNEYFKRARHEFENLDMSNDKAVKKYAREGYDLVLDSDDYFEYATRHYASKISKLKESNKKLSRQNKKLRDLNNSLMSSSSWKMTKPLRFIKNYKK